jgi:hypothetical protein
MPDGRPTFGKTVKLNAKPPMILPSRFAEQAKRGSG